MVKRGLQCSTLAGALCVNRAPKWIQYMSPVFFFRGISRVKGLLTHRLNMSNTVVD